MILYFEAISLSVIAQIEVSSFGNNFWRCEDTKHHMRRSRCEGSSRCWSYMRCLIGSKLHIWSRYRNGATLNDDVVPLSPKKTIIWCSYWLSTLHDRLSFVTEGEASLQWRIWKRRFKLTYTYKMCCYCEESRRRYCQHRGMSAPTSVSMVEAIGLFKEIVIPQCNKFLKRSSITWALTELCSN